MYNNNNREAGRSASKNHKACTPREDTTRVVWWGAVGVYHAGLSASGAFVGLPQSESVLHYVL